MLINGDRFRSNMQSLDGEKAALLAARRHFLPLQSRVEKQKNYLERVSKEIETKMQKRLEILQKWTQAKHEMAIWVAEQTAENAKAVNQGIPVMQTHTTGSTSDQAAQQTMMQSMGCHSVWEKLTAADATDEDVKKNHPAYGTNSAATRSREHANRTRTRDSQSPVRSGGFQTKTSPLANVFLGSARWTPRARKPPTGACQTRSLKGNVWERSANKREKGCNLLRLWFWT